MGQTNLTAYSPMPEDEDHITIELHNRLDKKVTFEFYRRHGKKNYLVDYYTVSALSYVTISITSKAELVRCIHKLSKECKDYKSSKECTSAWLNEKKTRQIFVNTGYSGWVYLNKSESPWILIYERFNRDNLSVVNNSTENVSVIRKLDTVVVPPKSFMVFREYMDVATSSGSRLNIKDACKYNKYDKYPKPEAIARFKKDRLNFDCEYLSNTVKITITNRN